MFKKKPIYIILLIVFTLLLCADITAYSLTANLSGTSVSFPNDSSARPDFSSEDFDPSQMQGSGTMPDFSSEDFDPSQMQGSGTMPDFSSEDFDPSQMQGSFDRANMTQAAGSTSFLYSIADFVGTWWIPIGALCIIVDALCIFMLIRIKKKRKNPPDDDLEETEDEDEQLVIGPKISSYEKRREKRKRTMWIVIVFLALAIAAVLGFVIIKGIYTAQLSQSDNVPVVSAETVSTEIDTLISGTGTLADDDVCEITIPGGVEIEAYNVENGDSVYSGDILATVDHTSVKKTIADLQEAMDALDEDIEEASGAAIESAIEASVDGRVKVIYAQKDTAVTDTMYENGALMLISLDGLMAVDIETDADITTGDSVTVTLSDGEEVTGRVAKVSNGTTTITLTDDGTVYGDTVTVYGEGGSILGTSTLYIHSELRVTGYSGTVSKIKCEENEKVSCGDTLLNLSDTEYTAEYEQLISKRSEFEEEMLQLFVLYQDANIYADFDGTVSGIDDENTTDSLLTAQSSTLLASKAVCTLFAKSLSLLSNTADGLSLEALLGNNPGGTDDITAGEYSNYLASVSGVSYSSISLKEYSSSVSMTDYSAYASLGITAQMMTTDKQISPAVSTPVYMFEDGVWKAYSVSDISSGDVLILTYATADRTVNPVWIIIADKADTGGGSSGFSGGTHSSSSAAVVQDTEEETETLYEVSETTVMSITPAGTMSVTVTIDELDILSMQTGQLASITLDAIEGETFTGTVTDIDMEGTNSGGSTKYTAVVTLDRTDQMLAGMNAAVSIILSATDCSVTVPVAALVESDSGVYVYTSYDEESNILGSPASVQTGLSDGSYVEIVSGLEPGVTVWYEYNDEISISSSVVDSSGSGNFNIMQIFGGGRR